MAFGLTNAPAVFQRTINHVLRYLIGITVMVFIDDIVVFSKSVEEHREHFVIVYALNKLWPDLYAVDFVIYTDHKPLKSLFLLEVKNTKIQRWAVLIAGYGPPLNIGRVLNTFGRYAVADMLSTP